MEETILHALRDCPRVAFIWSKLVHPSKASAFFMGDLQGWIDYNMTNDLGMDTDLHWASIWAMACHALWRWRNKGVHDNSLSWPLQAWWSIKHHYKEYIHAQAFRDSVHKLQQQWVDIKWKQSDLNLAALHTDGAV